jgi:hypothetical protein
VPEFLQSLQPLSLRTHSISSHTSAYASIR